MDIFCKAFGLYKQTGTQDKVEVALREIGDWSGEESFKAAFSEMLLKHHLRVLNYLFIY
jgi:hypothetical protein